MPKTRASSPRFKRPKTAPGVVLMEDDVAILWHVFRHRVIDSKSLYQLFPNRHQQVISRRLRKLWMAGFLDRPVSQNRRNANRAGSDHLAYAIAREGARALRDGYDAPIPVQRWSQKNAELKPMSIAHHLATTRFMVAFASGAEQVADAHVRYADELIPPRDPDQPVTGLKNTIRADVAWHINGAQQGTAPDQIIALDHNGERQVFFIEIDQGTETVEPGEKKLKSPRFWSDTSFLRKMLIYGAAFRAGAHKQQFGFPAFRVLTVTTQPDRVELMQAAYQRHMSSGTNKAPAGLFLFTDWKQLAEAREGAVQMSYVNAAGRTVTLLP